MPFAQGTVRQIKMDLVQLALSGNTHMVISADSITVDDLRLAYSQIMNQHIAEQQDSRSSTGSPKQAADVTPSGSPMRGRGPEGGASSRRKSDVGSRPSKDTSASGLRYRVSNRDVPLSGEVMQDQERARAAFSRPSVTADLSRSHSLPGPSTTTSPQAARSSKGKALPKAKRKVQGSSPAGGR